MKNTSYWLINKGCILALAAIPASYAIGWHDLTPLRPVPAWIGQLLAVSGALIFITHFLGLKRRVGQLSDPDHLVRDFGLYRWLRHPMYFGDLLLLAGLCLIYPTVPGLALWLAGSVAALLLAHDEDVFLAGRFVEFSHWKRHSRMILPGIF